ncbi:cysteine proteinase [Rhizophagus irregularis]|uniref:Cysteine proteinase n=1 Tax=Rhizophagus irregularis TaxID=588596 RepID=A0A2I1HDN4_9GLOM|nr:cysteine proteinase [Rhizophagus irregularis]
MSDLYDITEVIMASDELAAEDTMPSNDYYESTSPRISTPPESFPEVSTIFKYEKDTRLEVMEWLSRNNDNNKNVIYINSESITAEKLYDLCDKHIWLSSDHINAYLSYLNSKFHRVFSLTTFFYTRLTEIGGYKYSSIEHWTKRIEIFQKDIIFIPININESHWILAAIFMKEQFRIAILDSLGMITTEGAVNIGGNLIRWLNDEYFHKIRLCKGDACEFGSDIIGEINLNGQVDFALDIMFRNGDPPQVDGSSCGVFVCMFARLMAENIERDIIMKIAKFREASIKFRKVIYTDLWEYAKENKQVDIKFEVKYDEYK